MYQVPKCKAIWRRVTWGHVTQATCPFFTRPLLLSCLHKYVSVPIFLNKALKFKDIVI